MAPRLVTRKSDHGVEFQTAVDDSLADEAAGPLVMPATTQPPLFTLPARPAAPTLEERGAVADVGMPGRDASDIGQAIPANGYAPSREALDARRALVADQSARATATAANNAYQQASSNGHIPTASEVASVQQRASSAPAAPVGPITRAQPATNPVDRVNSGIVVTPGRGGSGMALTGRQVSSRQGSPEVEAAIAASAPINEKAIAGLHQLGTIEERENAELANVSDSLGKQQRGIDAQSEETMRGRLGEQEHAYNRFLDAADRASNLFVDSDRRNTGDRVMGGIASFLGGLAGGPNQALATINEALQRDAHAQMANQNNANAAAANQHTAYNIARENGADERTAYELQLAHATRDAANEARRLGQLATSEGARSRSNVLVADLENKYLQHISNAHHLAGGQQSTQESFRRVGGSGGHAAYIFTQRGTGQRHTIPSSAIPAGILNDPQKLDDWAFARGYERSLGSAGAGLSEGSLGRIAHIGGDISNANELGRAAGETRQQLERDDPFGRGPIEGRLPIPDALLQMASPGYSEFQQRTARLGGILQTIRTGASAGAQREYNRLEREAGNLITAPHNDALGALSRIEQEAAAIRRDDEARMSPQELAQYRSRQQALAGETGDETSTDFQSY